MTLRLPLLLLALCACEATVEENLDEGEANAIVVALNDAEIGARKEAMEGDEGRFRVLVPNDDVGDALRQLRADGLPRVESTGFEDVFGEGGLVPTATEEQARFVAALGGELASSIESIEGVLDARVHVALPDTRRVSLDDQAPQARASVLIKYRGANAPYDEAAVKALVAGAVQHLAEDDVSVVGVGSPVNPGVERGRIVSVGPFAVTRGSAFALKATLGGALLVHVLLAALVLVAMRRRKVLVPPSAPPEPTA